MTKAGAFILPSFIHMEPVTCFTVWYLQEKILRLQVGTWLSLCIGTFAWNVWSRWSIAPHIPDVSWMQLNGQLHPPPTVVNIISVGQEAKWAADPIGTCGGEIQNWCSFWESIPATWIKLQRRNLQTVLNILLLLNAGGHHSFLFETQKGKYMDTRRGTRITPTLLWWKLRLWQDHVRAVDVGRSEETCVVMQKRSPPVINSTTLRNYGQF